MENHIDTSSSLVIKAIKSLAVPFSQKHNLNALAIENLSTGVIDRINIFGIKSFADLTKEQKGVFIKIAVVDYFDCSKKLQGRSLNDSEFRSSVTKAFHNIIT